MYVEDLKRGPNVEIGPKDFFEIASNGVVELLQAAPLQLGERQVRIDKRNPACGFGVLKGQGKKGFHEIQI